MRIVGLLVSALLFAGTALAADPSSPSPKDKCPVCGMFVARHPTFAAQLVFRDGTALHFDGVKDLAKYVLGLSPAVGKNTPSGAEGVWVKDYYTVRWIDGRKALYVAGSDVLGPMGRELVAFGAENAAKEFFKSHKGTRLLRFGEFTPETIRELDR